MRTRLQENAQTLRSIAQNDYMINSKYLPEGRDLLEIAARIEELESTTVTTEYHDHIVNEKLVEIERLRKDLAQARAGCYACEPVALENERLRGDLEIMRLQRDATQASRCSNCERLRAVEKHARALLEGGGDEAVHHLQAALKGVDTNETK